MTSRTYYVVYEDGVASGVTRGLTVREARAMRKRLVIAGIAASYFRDAG